MACISLASLAGQGHMESRWARDESPWPLASRPLAAAALSSRSTVAKLCPPAITVKACRPPTDTWRARRVKPPIPNQDDRYHPLACMPALPLREAYDERSRVFPQARAPHSRPGRARTNSQIIYHIVDSVTTHMQSYMCVVSIASEPCKLNRS